jgi:hypothetical protein
MKLKARANRTARPMRKPAPSVIARAGAQPAKDDINWLNAGLMIMACAGAIAAPFHVFLFAYIVLGPLHYLTEISWLHDRNYFTRRNVARRWWLALVFVAILVLALASAGTDPSQRIISPVVGIALIYVVFATAAAALYVRDWRTGLGLLFVLAVGVLSFRNFHTYAWAFLAVNLLTTIVHVFIFTGAFILLGALKSRSRVAVLSLFVFASCAIVATTVTAPFAVPTARVRQLYLGFELLNKELLLLFGRSQGVYESVGIGVMRLIAFAYLYHYLNWFSKTSIIKWHEVTQSRALTIFSFWLAGGMIYLYDYRLGLAAFYILSMLHVFLEFPLNHQTFVEIGKSLSAGLRSDYS